MRGERAVSGVAAAARQGAGPLLFLLVLLPMCATPQRTSERQDVWSREALVCPTRAATESLTCTPQTFKMGFDHSYGLLSGYGGPGVALLRSTTMPCGDIAVACTGRTLAGELRQRGGECRVLIEMPARVPGASPRSSVCKISDRTGGSDTYFFYLRYASHEPGDPGNGRFFAVQLANERGTELR